MLLNKSKSIINIIGWYLLLSFFLKAGAFDLARVNSLFDFGTLSVPFTDLTITNSNVCVGYTLIVEPSTYHVRATSSSSSTTAFQMTNATNGTYKLTYSVSWAGSSGGSPTYVPLSSGQNSSTAFPGALLGGLTCALLPGNATLQLQLLSSNQMLAKAGIYNDTLTILIVP